MAGESSAELMARVTEVFTSVRHADGTIEELQPEAFPKRMLTGVAKKLGQDTADRIRGQVFIPFSMKRTERDCEVFDVDSTDSIDAQRDEQRGQLKLLFKRKANNQNYTVPEFGINDWNNDEGQPQGKMLVVDLGDYDEPWEGFDPDKNVFLGAETKPNERTGVSETTLFVVADYDWETAGIPGAAPLSGRKSSYPEVIAIRLSSDLAAKGLEMDTVSSRNPANPDRLVIRIPHSDSVGFDTDLLAKGPGNGNTGRVVADGPKGPGDGQT